MTTVRYCINGKLVSGIAPTNRGFAYGDGVFRTMRLLDGELQDWPQHYQTLVADCSKIQIVCPSADLLMQDFRLLVSSAAAEEAASGIIKIIITRGEGARGYAPPAICEPTRVLVQSPLPVYPAAIYQQGVALYTCQTRLAQQPLLAGIKHLNRLENVLARAELKDPRFFDGLLRDYDGHVIEAVSGNLLIQKENVIMTPALDQCGVAGVMRQKIMDWYRTHGQPVAVTAISLEQLLAADAVVIANSVYGVLQVTQIDDHVMATDHWAKELRSHLHYIIH
ncbi:4-amino-4-deoxychorismate lyase [Methylophilus rhizosphaerae]|uniref:aminodeoxychorismate lyase n=1 Tax=Methylophilus rhizosphaerae TaxID=492660 RepID=A0A1G8ZAB3_9PROT|nr:aminodeoxychorismate lyase [Methylophilus rhizosphaerae]SDK11345.1 4-amino-4-deoxychorismate lyase [Methylophilus rhizosphaerae]